jgi:hypothetical protein
MNKPFYHAHTGYNSLWDEASEPNLTLEEVKAIMEHEMSDNNTLWMLAENSETSDEVKRYIMCHTMINTGVLLALARNPSSSSVIQSELLQHPMADNWSVPFGLVKNPNLDYNLSPAIVDKCGGDTYILNILQTRFAENTKLGKIL